MIEVLYCCVAAVVLEFSSAWLLESVNPSALHVVYFLCAHSVACLLLALSLPEILPARYRGPGFIPCLFIFSVAFFMPLFGTVGLLAAIVPALRWHRQTRQPTQWLHASVFTLPQQPAEPRRIDWLPGPGHLTGFLQHAVDPQKRLRALIATLELDDQHAVPLLRLALKDPEDDVRLLAYALLNRKEKAIEGRIRERLTQLESATPDNGFAQHKALACDYWELAHLGVPQGSSHLSLCERAREHAEAGVRLCNQDAGLQFLLGRILLHDMDLDGASVAFEQARKSGIDVRKTSPYFAEIAYLNHRFSDIGNYLNGVGMVPCRSPLNDVSAYWRAAEP